MVLLNSDDARMCQRTHLHAWISFVQSVKNLGIWRLEDLGRYYYKLRSRTNPSGAEIPAGFAILVLERVIAPRPGDNTAALPNKV